MSIVLSGQGVSSGVARGKVLVIKDPTVSPLIRGEFILVTPFVTPVLAPLLINAKALILEYGGITAHGASVAREFGIPCVVQIPISKIQDGDLVEVDGSAGTVAIMADV